MKERIVLHVDFDYFYAQCEEIRDPNLRTKPVAVCVFSDRGEDSGAIATANYLARGFGVKSGMPIKFAKSRLGGSPDAAFLPTDFDYYSDMSQKAMDIIREFADVFEYVGRDEAYLDITQRTLGEYGRASHLGQQIKNAVREKTKLRCSIGISPNRMLSKIASDYKKPDGLTVVSPEKISAFLEPLSIMDIPGIGKKTGDALYGMGLKTIGDLRSPDVFALQQKFGRRAGTYIHNAARGIDDEPVTEREPSIQYSKMTTLRTDSKDPEFLSENLQVLCSELHRTVLKSGRLFKSVGVQFVQSDLSQKSRSRMLRSPTSGLAELEKNAQHLLLEALQDQEKPVRRMGVKVSELSDLAGQSSMDAYF